MAKPYCVVIELNDCDKFQEKVNAFAQEGYVMSSSSCGFVNEVEYNFCSTYQAVMVLALPLPVDNKTDSSPSSH